MKVTLSCITAPRIRNKEGTAYLTPEEYIIYEARLSSKDRLNNETAPKLMNYLLKQGHWSPFEMISIGIEIETSRAIAQQMLRHRSFSFQEFSQRYAEVTEMEPIRLRLQAKKNRQSSVEATEDRELNILASDCVAHCEEVYAHLLDNGVAKECARMVLPLTTRTTLTMHGTLRSWIHFFDQRCSAHAQLEIQQIAREAESLVAVECPWTAKALGWI